MLFSFVLIVLFRLVFVLLFQTWFGPFSFQIIWFFLLMKALKCGVWICPPFLEPMYAMPPVSRLDGPKGEGMSWRLSLGFLEEVSKGLRKIASVLRGPRGHWGSQNWACLTGFCLMGHARLFEVFRAQVVRKHGSCATRMKGFYARKTPYGFRGCPGVHLSSEEGAQGTQLKWFLGFFNGLMPQIIFTCSFVVVMPNHSCERTHFHFKGLNKLVIGELFLKGVKTCKM